MLGIISNICFYQNINLQGNKSALFSVYWKGMLATNIVHSSKPLAYPGGMARIEVPLTRQHLVQNCYLNTWVLLILLGDRKEFQEDFKNTEPSILFSFEYVDGLLQNTFWMIPSRVPVYLILYVITIMIVVERK